MKHHTFLSRAFVILATLLATGSASALEVTLTESGSLSTNITDPASVTSLTVSGPVNAADLYFIGRSMTSLTDLDLGNSRIEAYSGARLEGHSSFAAGTIPAMSLSGLPLSRFIFPTSGDITIGEGAFAGTSLTTLTFPDNIESVGMGAYAGCHKLTSVTMPVVNVGDGVFRDCTALKTVNMSYATEIPASAFRGCTALTEVRNASNVNSIGQYAFQGCTSLASFDFGSSLRLIGNGAFASSGLKEADLSRCSGLDKLGDKAFADCSELVAVTLPPYLEQTGNGLFLGDSGLTDITIPAGLIAIGDHALAGSAVATTSLELPDGLETIGDYALAGAKRIESIKLPGSLIKIGTGAMQNMTGLDRIQAEALAGPTALGSDVWHGVNQPAVTVTVGIGLVDTFKAADQWSEFTIVDTSGVDDINADKADVKVVGRFDGTDLIVKAINSEIVEARLFATDGRLLATANPGDDTAIIDTAGFPAGVFIVTVNLVDGSTATLKTSRR